MSVDGLACPSLQTSVALIFLSNEAAWTALILTELNKPSKQKPLVIWKMAAINKTTEALRKNLGIKYLTIPLRERGAPMSIGTECIITSFF